jgi:hypothetical protein
MEAFAGVSSCWVRAGAGCKVTSTDAAIANSLIETFLWIFFDLIVRVSETSSHAILASGQATKDPPVSAVDDPFPFPRRISDELIKGCGIFAVQDSRCKKFQACRDHGAFASR